MNNDRQHIVATFKADHERNGKIWIEDKCLDNKCARCGSNEFDLLSFDHSDGEYGTGRVCLSCILQCFFTQGYSEKDQGREITHDLLRCIFEICGIIDGFYVGILINGQDVASFKAGSSKLEYSNVERYQRLLGAVNDLQHQLHHAIIEAKMKGDGIDA